MEVEFRLGLAGITLILYRRELSLGNAEKLSPSPSRGVASGSTIRAKPGAFILIHV